MVLTSEAELPNYEDLAVATLKALLQRGGPASNQEIDADVAGLLQLSAETREIPHGTGSSFELSEFTYRARWARTYLKHVGAVENISRGVWSATEEGRSLDASGVEAVKESYREARRRGGP